MRNCLCQRAASIPRTGDAALCAVSLRALSLPLLHCRISPCHAGTRLTWCCCPEGLVGEHGSISPHLLFFHAQVLLELVQDTYCTEL